MKVLYDDEADALYIPLVPKGTGAQYSIRIDADRIVDLDSQKDPVGIEVLGASRRVLLSDLVERFGLEERADDLMSIERFRFRPKAGGGPPLDH
ncbi:MAG: DUF2283 domain-containing protein [Actinomycetota bacterium]